MGAKGIPRYAYQMQSREVPAPIFLLLLIPFGVSAGYAGVTLGFLLAKGGMPTAAIAAIVAFSVWPQTWKMLWAPLVDNFLKAKTWYVLGAVITGLAFVALSSIHASAETAPILTVLVILSSVSSTMVSMASELFMAYDVDEARKGAVSGWSQAGNLGGAGIGGGLGLYLSQHYAPWIGGWSLFLLCVVCCGGLFFVREPVRAARTQMLVQGFGGVLRDVWSVLRSRAGILVLILMLLPIGSGGAQGVWAAIAGEWHTGADVVALVNGVMGGVASLIGAVAGGFICDRMDRRTAYCLFGIGMVLIALAMALLPRTPLIFIICTFSYALVLGACYAGYSAAVLEAIGKGAAATKFNLLSAASNVPIAYMTGLDGQFHDQYGSRGMLLGEAVIGTVAVIGFALFALSTKKLFRREPVAAEP